MATIDRLSICSSCFPWGPLACISPPPPPPSPNPIPLSEITPPQWPSGQASLLFAGDSRIPHYWVVHTSALNTGTLAASLPDAWCYRVSAGTGGFGVSRLWLSGIASLLCNSFLSVVGHKIVDTDVYSEMHFAFFWDVDALCLFLGCKTTKKQQITLRSPSQCTQAPNHLFNNKDNLLRSSNIEANQNKVLWSKEWRT